MCPVSVDRSHQAFREGLHQAVDQHQPSSDINAAKVSEIAKDVFRLTKTNFDDAAYDRISERAAGAGLTEHDLTVAFQEAVQHVALAHEFVQHQAFRADVAAAGDTRRGTFLQRLGEHLGLSLRSSSFYDSSVPSKLEDPGKGVDVAALTDSAVEQQIVKKRYDQYMELGGPAFRRTVERYQAGEFTYQELLDHPSYVVGIRTITEELPIDDDFKLETSDRSAHITVDTYNPDVITAIRRHFAFVLKSEIAQTAELRQLGVISVPDMPEYTSRSQEHPQGAVAKVKHFFTSDFTMRLGRLLRVAATNATAWSIGGAYIGGQLAMVTMDNPNQWLTKGCVVLGAVLAGAGIRGVRAASEATLRQKQRRTEIGLGTITNRDGDLDRQLVPDADLFRTQLLNRAEQLEQAVEGTVGDLQTALQNLYHTIADVRARLRRSREGNKPPHSDHNKGPLRIERPRGKPLTHKGPLRTVRPETPDDKRDLEALTAEPVADQPERFDSKQPKQDYINFGVGNRFASQQELAEALGQALSVLERVQPPEGKLRKAWNKQMQAIDEQAEHHMDQIQAAVNREIDKFEKQYTVEAMRRGATAGLISGLAIATLSYPHAAFIAAEWVANRTPQKLQPSKYRAGQSHDSLVAQDQSGRTMEDLELPHLQDTYEAARTERLERTRPQREQAAREQIRRGVDTVEGQYGELLDAMQTLLRAVQGTGAIAPEQIAAIQTHAAKLGEVASHGQALHDLLDVVDEDFSYRDIDATEDGRLARLLGEVDALAGLGTQVINDITRQLGVLNQEARRVRQLPDDQLDAASRQQQLELTLRQMESLRDAVHVLHPGLIDQSAFDRISYTVDGYREEINNAITVMVLRRYMSIDTRVGPIMERVMQAEQMIDSSDPSKIGTHPWAAQQLARKLQRAAPTASPAEFVTLGFVTTGRVPRVNQSAIENFIRNP